VFKNFHPLAFWFGVILSIIMIGVTGFMLIEGFSFFDALYMTIITVSTIGYGETNPLSSLGRIFNICFIITSFSILTYAFATITRYVTSGEMQLYFKNKKLMKQVDALNNHVIICGFGRNGQQAARTLRAHKLDFIVIDSRSQMIDLWFEHEGGELLYIVGDATDDSTLKKAGIEKADSLVCALPDDANNVFIVLSARTLNPKMKIISRASKHTSINKLKTAGADSISMPELLGGVYMATQVSKPDVIEFIEYLTGDEGESINIESIDYDRLPPNIRDTSLKTIMDWKKTGVTCIGVKDELGKFLINPNSDIVIKQGMKVIVLGNRQQIHAMKHNVGEE
jgi:voltage-gated potassium channel